MRNVTLYPHQTDVLERTRSHTRCAYYLDMGLGKTFVGSEKAISLGESILVICQKSKVADWVEHFKTYSDSDVYDLTNKKSWNMYLEDIELTNVAVINYELAWRRPELLKLDGFTLMLDESSLIGNEKSERAKFILKLRPKNVILLSGTPCSGKYERLWSQCQLLGWNIRNKDFLDRYVIRHLDKKKGYYFWVIDGYRNVDELKDKLREHGAVFMKTNDVMQLPDQIEQTIRVNPTPEYKKFQKTRYVEADGVEFVGDTTLTRILCERKLCGTYNHDKMTALKDLIESTNDRLIIFYNFNEELNALKKLCKALDRPVSEVNGRRRDTINYDFKDNSILLVQYMAGAMGGNYQKANKVIYFTLPLGKGSCDLWEQSKKRIHRIGQERPCFYYYLLVDKSFEERNLKMLKVGKELTDDLFFEEERK